VTQRDLFGWVRKSVAAVTAEVALNLSLLSLSFAVFAVSLAAKNWTGYFGFYCNSIKNII
jgi:hypothetical protein